MKKLLIVVDMQNDFVTGSLANQTAAAIIPNIKAEIESGSYDSVIFTQDTHYSSYLRTQEGINLPVEHCLFGTEGWNIVPELKQYTTDDNCIYKGTFGYDGWGNEYANILCFYDEITLVGTCTDICVVSNALILKASFPDIVISVKADCCAGVTPEKHNAAIEVMKSCQVKII